MDRVKKTDCRSELRRLLKSGPPIYISDAHGFPLDEEEGEEYVVNLWYASDGKVHPAVLRGAVQGEERKELWDNLKEVIQNEIEGEDNGNDGNDVGIVNGADGAGDESEDPDEKDENNENGDIEKAKDRYDKNNEVDEIKENN